MPYFKTPDGSVYDFRISEKDIKITKKEYDETRKADSKRFLLSVLKPGQTVYGDVKSVSRSGMSRTMRLYTLHDGQLLNITWHVAQLAGEMLDKNDNLRVGGCGMDMVFNTVYNLGYRLWPQGTPEPHGTRNGEPDTDGGYALKSAYL